MTPTQLQARTTSTFTDMPDTDFVAYLKMLDDTWKDLPTDKATAYGWKIFLACTQRFGYVTLTGQGDDLTPELGDVVYVSVAHYPGHRGIFPLAMTQAALTALTGEPSTPPYKVV